MSKSLGIVQKFHPEVEKVVDAKKPVTIAVTSRDANSAKVKAHKDCALAVACKRSFGLDGVVVSRAVAYLVDGKTATRYLMSESAVRELVSFDRGGTFEPGEYRLNKPHEGIALGNGHDRPTSKRRKKDRDTRREPRHITTNIRGVLGGQAK